MKTLVKKLALTVLICGCLGNALPTSDSTVSPDVKKQHIAPRSAQWKEYPYFVAITQDTTVLGGGAIISEDVIATRYGLVNESNISAVKIRYGDVALDVLEVIDYSDKQAATISLIKLKSKISGSTIKLQDGTVPLKTDCQVVGVGVTYEEVLANTLHYTTVPIDAYDCGYYINKYSGDYLCTGVNQPDFDCGLSSGDPLVCNGALTGITTSDQLCTLFATVGVYGDVYKYKDWIETQVYGGPSDQTTTPGAATITYLNKCIAMISALIFVFNFRFK